MKLDHQTETFVFSPVSRLAATTGNRITFSPSTSRAPGNDWSSAGLTELSFSSHGALNWHIEISALRSGPCLEGRERGAALSRGYVM